VIILIAVGIGVLLILLIGGVVFCLSRRDNNDDYDSHQTIIDNVQNSSGNKKTSVYSATTFDDLMQTNNALQYDSVAGLTNTANFDNNNNNKGEFSSFVDEKKAPIYDTVEGMGGASQGVVYETWTPDM
jgi:hypothetical protein